MPKPAPSDPLPIVRASEGTALSCAVATILLGGLGALGWVTPWRSLASLHPGSIPMAPSSALALMLLAGTVVLELHRSSPGRTQAVSLLVLLFASHHLAAVAAGFHPRLDELLVPEPGLFDGVPTGRNSPLTALGLLLASLGLLFVGRAGRRPALGSVGASLALAVCLLGGIVTLGYVLGSPLLHGGAIVPVALPTGLALTCLAVALVGLAPRDSAPLRPFSGASARARLLRAFLPVALVVLVVEGGLDQIEGLNPALDVALSTLVSALVGVAVVAYTARGVGRELDLALRDADRLAAIVQSSSDAIYACGLDGTLVAWNPSAERLFGYASGEALGRSARILAPPGAANASGVILRRIDAGEGLERGDARAVRKDGSEVRVSITRSPLRDAEGRVVGTSVIARDVAEQRRAQDALRESEEKLRGLFESGTMGILFANIDGRIDDANEQMLRMSGYTRGDFQAGLRWVDLTPPEFLPSTAERIAEARERGSCAPYETQYFHKDGSRRWALVGFVLLEPDRQRAVAIVIDIDARKRAEEELRRSEARFAKVFQSDLIAIAIVERATGRLVDVNPRWSEFFGYAPDEAIGRTTVELDLWEDPAARAHCFATLAAGSPTSRGEGSFRHKSGEIRPALYSVEAITLPAIVEPLVMVIFVDITERKALESRLLESEQEYRLLFEGNPHPMWVFDAATLAFLAVNDAAVRLYGFSRDEFLNMTIEQIRPPEAVASLREHVATMGDALGLPATQVRHLKKDGSLLEVAGSSNPIQFRGRRAHLVLADDVTETRRLEAQLRQAQKMEAVGRLAGGVAHDFNNSLGVILGYTELLLLHASEAQRGKLEQILKSTQRAASLTRQLLAFSRKQVVDPKVLNLNAVLSELEGMLARLIGEDIDLAFVPGVDLGQVRADAAQLEQVVINLCVNARDAMPGGGLLRIETANVELDAGHITQDEQMAAGRYVKLAVSDTGCGIEPATLSQIFEPFFTTKSPGTGTGLGLAMAYGVVKQAGGYVWAYSEVGQGTTVKVYLPRVDEPVTAPEVQAPPVALRGQETILLVEDEAALREITCEILAESGYQVLEASGAAQALAIAGHDREPIHLLLTDVVMPGMNGRALAETLVALRPELAVLYMSGYTDDVIAHTGVLAPGTHLLEKPFTSAALLGRVRAALGDHGGGARA